MITTRSNLATLAQADVLLLLADLLQRPTSTLCSRLDLSESELCRLLGQAGWAEQADLLKALHHAVSEVRGLDEEGWAAEHARLFDAATLCPANESAYVRRDKGAVLADLAGFYGAFGFTHESASGEKCDHLRSQIQFAAVLLVMIHQAEANHDERAGEVAAAALVDFHIDHLGVWIATFCDQLQAVSSLTFYEHLAESLRLAWRSLCRSRALPEATSLHVAAHEPTDGTPYECGMMENMPGADAPVAVPLSVAGRAPTPGGGGAGEISDQKASLSP